MAARTLTPRERWVEEGLTVLAEGGVDAVRIEVLAKRLGVTKGGFYGHFKDRESLLQQMLATWEREAVDDVLAAVANEHDPKVRAQRAGALTFSDDRLLPIELGIRAWARRDPAVAERLQRVDEARMNLLRDVIGASCDDPHEVEARSLLAFCAAIGATFLTVDHGDQTREEVLARAAELLL